MGTENGDLEQGALTVVIPNLDHRHYLPLSIASAEQQSRRPARILVLDDGSTDGSVDLLREYAAAGKIELEINPRRLYVNGAINRGLAMTRTEFVTFLAADDLVEKTLYEAALYCLDLHSQAAFCATGVQWVSEAGAPLPQPDDPPILEKPGYISPERTICLLMRYGSFLNGTGCVFRTALLRGAGGFDPKLGSFADNFVQQTLAATHGICYVPERLAAWRRSSKSYSSQTGRSFDTYLDIIREIEDRLSKPEIPFPREYSARLLLRLKFDAARAALASAPPRSAEAAAIMPTLLRRMAVRLTGGRLGMPFSRAVLLLFLRPFDVLFAVRRRFRWPSKR